MGNLELLRQRAFASLDGPMTGWFLPSPTPASSFRTLGRRPGGLCRWWWRGLGGGVTGQVHLAHLAHLAPQELNAKVQRVLADRQRHQRLAEDAVIAEDRLARLAELGIRLDDTVAEVDVVRARAAHAERVPV